MKIKLKDGWFIEDEISGYVVYKVNGVNKDGTPKIDYMKYPSTLERCVEIIVRHNVIDDNNTEITLLDYMRKLKEEFEAVFVEVRKYINKEGN